MLQSKCYDGKLNEFRRTLAKSSDYVILYKRVSQWRDPSAYSNITGPLKILKYSFSNPLVIKYTLFKLQSTTSQRINYDCVS